MEKSLLIRVIGNIVIWIIVNVCIRLLIVWLVSVVNVLFVDFIIFL